MKIEADFKEGQHVYFMENNAVSISEIKMIEILVSNEFYDGSGKTKTSITYIIDKKHTKNRYLPGEIYGSKEDLLESL